MTENDINTKKREKFICVKLPAKVINEDKAIASIGGLFNVFEKHETDEDINLEILLKTVPLEKCFSNDLLIKRKTYRSKKNPNKKKNVYEIIGKIESQYEFFALHDFIYLTQDREDIQNSLENDLIRLDNYFNSKDNESLENLLNDKIKEIQSKDKRFEDLLQYLQPYSFTYRRHLYPHFVKQIKENLNDSDSEK